MEKRSGVPKCLLFPHLIPKTEFHGDAQSFVYKSRKCLVSKEDEITKQLTNFLLQSSSIFFKLQVNDGERENTVSKF